MNITSFQCIVTSLIVWVENIHMRQLAEATPYGENTIPKLLWPFQVSCHRWHVLSQDHRVWLQLKTKQNLSALWIISNYYFLWINDSHLFLVLIKDGLTVVYFLVEHGQQNTVVWRKKLVDPGSLQKGAKNLQQLNGIYKIKVVLEFGNNCN